MAKLDITAQDSAALPVTGQAQLEARPIIARIRPDDGPVAELQRARRVQQFMLPTTLPKIPGLSLAGICVNAGHLGGDFYDIIELEDKRILITVADVMGKGAPASLMAATLRGQIRGMANYVPEPAEILARINDDMTGELGRVDAFITAQIVLIEPWGRTMKIANAGHCPPMIVDSHGEVALVATDGFPLGIMPDIDYGQEQIEVDFHRMLLYTDGVTESRNPQGELFGAERLVNWLRQTASSHSSPQDLVKDLQMTIQAFQLSMVPEDDQTVLLITQP